MSTQLDQIAVKAKSEGHHTGAAWGARCGKSARRVLRGGTGARGFSSRSVPTHHNIDHELMNRAVRKHAKEKWAVLYILNDHFKTGHA